MCVVASALLNRNHGGVVPLLFLTSVFVDRKPRLLQFPFGLAACCMSIELRWWSSGQNEQYAQLLHCYLISSYCWDRYVPLKIPQILALFFRDINLKIFVRFFVLFWGEPVSFCLSIICQTSESITSWQGTNRSLSQHRGIKHVFFTVSDQSVKRYKVWDGGLCLPCLTFVFYYQFQWNNDVPEYRGLSCYAMSFLYWFTLVRLVTKSLKPLHGI